MERYNIYCDESCHLEHDGIKPMGLGAIWCKYEERMSFYQGLKVLKKKHGLSPYFELKWNAVSPAKLPYYLDVVDYFFSQEYLNFRVLVITNKEVLRHHDFAQNHDQFYYKMYFNLLKNIIIPNEVHNIYIDIKDTQGAYKVRKLHETLSNSKCDFKRERIQTIQTVRSHEVELIQLADFLLGAVIYAHRELRSSDAKINIIEKIKSLSGYDLMNSTLYREKKFNIFVWQPQ